MMTEDAEYAWYEAKLRGEDPELPNGVPQPGFYRLVRSDRSSVPVAIWRHGGRQVACIGDAPAVEADDEFFDAVFTRCCRVPIPEDLYFAIREDGAEWPDLPPQVMAQFSNLPAEPCDALSQQIEAERENLEAWFRSLGEAGITTKEQADKASNWTSQIDAIAKAADAKRVEEKRPHDEAAKAVQARWKPIVDAAGDLTRRLKSAVTPFLRAEERRLAEERAKALAANKPEAAAATPTRAHAGTKGVARTVALRTVRTAAVEDPKAFAAWLIEHNNADLADCLKSVAGKIARAGADAPGITVTVEQVAA